MTDGANDTTVDAELHWTHIPGEGMFKPLLDANGNTRASLQFREGFYVLGARDASTRRLIFFDRSNFESEEQAVSYFNEWASAHGDVRTTA